MHVHLPHLNAPAAVGASTSRLQIGEQGIVQLPSILRIMKQPCARNEAYSRVYPLRPFPLCTVPAAAEVRLPAPAAASP